jgi:hypothetical protein
MLYSHHAIDIQQHLRLYNLKSLVEKLNKVLECAFEAKVVADNPLNQCAGSDSFVE